MDLLGDGETEIRRSSTAQTRSSSIEKATDISASASVFTDAWGSNVARTLFKAMLTAVLIACLTTSAILTGQCITTPSA